jgi:hypothetical protein
VYAEVAKWIRALPDHAWQGAASVGRVVGTAQHIDGQYIADLAGFHQRQRLHDHRVEVVGVIHRKQQSLVARPRDHRVTFGDRVGHRLLDEDVAAHVERLQGQRAMACWRREHVDRVGLPGAERGKIRGHELDAEGFRQRAGGGLVEIADTDDLDKIKPAQRGDVITGDVSGTDDGNAKFPLRTGVHPGPFPAS